MAPVRLLRRATIVRLAGVVLVALAGFAVGPAAAMPDFRLPPGFVIEELVADVPNARSMALGPTGTLFVGTRRGGRVYAVRGAFSGDPEVLVVAADLEMPNGVALRDGDLYVAEPRRILRFADIESRLDALPASPEVAVADLPYDSPLHAWKYIAFAPDGRLFVPVGAPCNVCLKPGFAGILAMQPDGGEREMFAEGVRNSVGFDWHPQTGVLWFTDNGRDMLGDEVPPCELNRAPRSGLHFGFPRCHGVDILDPKFGEPGACAGTVAPVQPLAPHSAPLAVRFYTGTMFPAEYRNQVFIAEHGSWNRSKAAGRTGYRVTLVRLDGSEPVAYEPFLEGFLDGEQVRGRPVDLLVAPDGALLVSDDERGAIYRVSYRGEG